MTAGEKFVAFILYFILFGFLLWFPAWLFKKAWQSWVAYVRGEFYAKQKYKLLELRIPRGLAKSPLSMEVFLHALFQPGGEATWYDKYWKGQTKAWFTLEMVSIEGRVGFYIWTREGFVDLIKTQLYSQFPDIGIIGDDEMSEDYASKINYDAGTHKATCAEIQKKNGGHYPIRTYEGFNLHKDPKEEFKIDPITPVLEYLGSLGTGEQAWIQIGIRAPSKETPKNLPPEKDKRKAARKEKKLPWYATKEMVDWTDAAKDEIKKLTKRDVKIEEGSKGPSAAEMKFTKEEEEKIAAVERQMAKVAFETNIRIVYVAKKDNFSMAHSAGILGTFKQYNTLNLNSFELKIPNVSYPWQDRGGKKVEFDKRNIFLQYQARAFFYPQFLPIGGREGDSPKDWWLSSKHVPGKPFIMNTEELATIFHFPGDVARTPTLSRVEAKKGEAPFNLPI